MLVSDVMQKNVIICTKEQPVTEAAKLMADHELGMLVVVNDDVERIPVGVVSDFDIMQKVVSKGLNPASVHVWDIMTSNVATITPEKSVADASIMMRKLRIKRLPVIDEKQLVGIISSMDILQCMVDVKKALIDMALDL